VINFVTTVFSRPMRRFSKQPLPPSVAQPMLYTSIGLRWEETRAPPIAPLLSTLLRRSDLAAQVDELKMDGDAFWGPGPWDSRQPPKIRMAEEHLTEFTACIDAMQHPHRREWIEAPEQGTMDALIALLVSRLPNLSSTHLESGAAKKATFSERCSLQPFAASPPAVCPRFHDCEKQPFSLPCLATAGGCQKTQKTFSHCFYLPGLEYLHARLDSPFYLSWPAGGVTPPCNSQFTTLK
jgi:hypothetical protein